MAIPSCLTPLFYSFLNWGVTRRVEFTHIHHYRDSPVQTVPSTGFPLSPVSSVCQPQNRHIQAGPPGWACFRPTPTLGSEDRAWGAVLIPLPGPSVTDPTLTPLWPPHVPPPPHTHILPKRLSSHLWELPQSRKNLQEGWVRSWASQTRLCFWHWNWETGGG